MSRDDGFAIADIDTAKHIDPKFKRLWRLLRDETEMNAATVLYEAVQLSSWLHGERVTAEDAAPAWMSDVATPTTALMAAGLLDDEGRVPRQSWAKWFGTAVERRDNLREKWRRANKRRSKSATTQSPSGNSGGTAAPVRPSVQQSDRTDTQYRAPRIETGLAPIGKIIETFPPFHIKEGTND